MAAEFKIQVLFSAVQLVGDVKMPQSGILRTHNLAGNKLNHKTPAAVRWCSCACSSKTNGIILQDRSAGDNRVVNTVKRTRDPPKLKARHDKTWWQVTAAVNEGVLADESRGCEVNVTQWKTKASRYFSVSFRHEVWRFYLLIIRSAMIKQNMSSRHLRQVDSRQVSTDEWCVEGKKWMSDRYVHSCHFRSCLITPGCLVDPKLFRDRKFLAHSCKAEEQMHFNPNQFL